MKYVRMIVWMLLLVVLVAFSIANWQPVEVKIWDNLILETKIPALVIVAFFLGLVPMWLIHRGTRWRLERRISGLESAHRSINPAIPAATSTPTLSPAPTPTPTPTPASDTIPGL